MASGRTPRRELDFPKPTDADQLCKDLETLAVQLDNDAETGQGKLSERPGAKLRGRFWLVTGEANPALNEILWWDSGSTWIEVNGNIRNAQVAAEAITNTSVKKESLEPNRLEPAKLTSTQIKPESIKAASLEKKSIGDEQVATNRVLMETGNSYSAQEERTSGTEYEPNATRPTFVVLQTLTTGEVNAFLIVWVGGVLISNQNNSKEGNPQLTFSFMCPPGQKWKATCNAGSLKSSYLTM